MGEFGGLEEPGQTLWLLPNEPHRLFWLHGQKSPGPKSGTIDSIESIESIDSIESIKSIESIDSVDAIE